MECCPFPQELKSSCGLCTRQAQAWLCRILRDGGAGQEAPQLLRPLGCQVGIITFCGNAAAG